MANNINQEDILRAALFVPCETKEHLHKWIKVYLGLDLPNVTVCSNNTRHPPSNSNPMDLIWEIYSKARAGNDENFTRILGFAARDSYKTVSASILETLCLFHLGRNVGHMAALETQAKNCQRYIEGYLKRPIIREFLTSKNKRTLEITKYVDSAGGRPISPVEYGKLNEAEKMRYEEKTNWIKIVIATVADCNGLHVPMFVCVDEKSKILIKSPKNQKDRIWANAGRVYNRLIGKSPGSNSEFEGFTQNPLKNIEALSFNLNTGEFEFKPIIGTSRTWQDRYEVNFKNGKKIICTEEHPLMSPNGFKKVSELSKNDKVLFLDENDSKNAIEIENITKIDPGWVIDFTVKDNHNFIANGVLVKNCDELDLADPAAYAESKMIPCMGDNGELPMTFLTSTRKYSFGLVQSEIDVAHTTGLNIRHWNIIDVTEACPSSRHLPELPKIPIYYSENQLRAISKEEYELLSVKEKEQYDVTEGFQGCLAKCKLFAACQGRLATQQTSKSKLLKKIHAVQPLFQSISVDLAKAQLLSWEPSSEGKIFPNFSKPTHLIPASQMAERITGETYPASTNKAQLIELLKSMGAIFYSGLDWGFTHNFAVVTAALLGHNLYIIDVISIKGLELQQRIELCREKLNPLTPVIYPDNAYPSDVKSFRMAGFRMVNFRKDVLLGIENTRKRIMPGGGLPPSMFLLKDDPGCELLADKIINYHWKTDQAGKLTDEPDSKDDDELDALRYLCQNVPINKINIVPGYQKNKLFEKDPNEGWIQRYTGLDEEVKVVGKPGGLLFSI
jgi:hypothetical protein